MVLTLIENADLYTPDPAGRGSILAAGGSIVRVGSVDRTAVEALGLPLEVINADGSIVTPGFIDPHQHSIGGAGEEGFATRTTEITLDELVQAGVTTAVGLLGTDTTSRHLTSLLAKIRQLEAGGITAYMYTGGFPVPTPTITGSVTDDIVLIDKVIGAGEIAISDVRSSQPTVSELARLVAEAANGGRISGQAGVTHFHTGPGRGLLGPLHQLLDDHDIEPSCLYATHINRSPELMDDAIALARRGAFVDIDTVDQDLPQQLTYYVDHGGDLRQLTASSDAQTAGATVAMLYESFVACARDGHVPLADILQLFTRNPATALKLERKGRIAEGADADLLIIAPDTLVLCHVIARGRILLREGVSQWLT